MSSSDESHPGYLSFFTPGVVHPDIPGCWYTEEGSHVYKWLCVGNTYPYQIVLWGKFMV